jgi:hypothetical protein
MQEGGRLAGGGWGAAASQIFWRLRCLIAFLLGSSGTREGRGGKRGGGGSRLSAVDLSEAQAACGRVDCMTGA